MADFFDHLDDEPDFVRDDKPATTADRLPVPEGEHRLTITRLEDNPDGFNQIKIALSHEDRRYGWVWQRLPKDQGWSQKIAHELRLALALPKGGLAPAMADGSLIGREVTAKIYHKPNKKSGGVYVNVGGFSKATTAVIEAATAATPATLPKRGRRDTPDDDIPF